MNIDDKRYNRWIRNIIIVLLIIVGIISLNLTIIFGGTYCFKNILLININESTTILESIVIYTGSVILIICLTSIVITCLILIFKLIKNRNHVCNSYEDAITNYLNK